MPAWTKFGFDFGENTDKFLNLDLDSYSEVSHPPPGNKRTGIMFGILAYFNCMNPMSTKDLDYKTCETLDTHLQKPKIMSTTTERNKIIKNGNPIPALLLPAARNTSRNHLAIFLPWRVVPSVTCALGTVIFLAVTVTEVTIVPKFLA